MPKNSSQSEMVGFLFCPKHGFKRLTHTEYKWIN
nr:MAG TPA: hypothetical protein [Caudoviricetes sp.]